MNGPPFEQATGRLPGTASLHPSHPLHRWRRIYRRIPGGADIPFDPDFRHIEHGMIPLYKALRAVPGACPVACCHGHSGVSPFIAFRAQQPFAYRLKNWLDLGHGPGHTTLKCWWGLTAAFWAQWEDELIWRLDTSHTPNRLFGGLTGRRRIDRDLVSLARAISDLAATTTLESKDPNPNPRTREFKELRS